MIDVPETLPSHRERGRLTARLTTQGRCTDDDSNRTPLVALVQKILAGAR